MGWNDFFHGGASGEKSFPTFNLAQERDVNQGRFDTFRFSLKIAQGFEQPASKWARAGGEISDQGQADVRHGGDEYA